MVWRKMIFKYKRYSGDKNTYDNRHEGYELGDFLV